MVSTISNALTRLSIRKRAISSKIASSFVGGVLGRCMLSSRRSGELRVTPCKSRGPDIYIKNFNEEYAIPGKNIVHKIRLSAINSYLEDKMQSDRVLVDLHSFNWIGHVGTVANKNVRKIIKNQISFWLHKFHRIEGIAWSPLVTARRLSRWLNCYFVIKSSEKELLHDFEDSIHKQAKYIYLIRGLYTDLEWVTVVYKALLFYSVSMNDGKMTKRLSRELSELFDHTNTSTIDTITPVEMVNTLVDLLDIIMLSTEDVFRIRDLIQQLRNMIFTVNSESGLGIFGSIYTPTRQFVSSLLSESEIPLSADNARFKKATSFSSDLVIDKKNPFFAFDFHFANQISDISNVSLIVPMNKSQCSSRRITSVKMEEDRGYFLFSGQSIHDYDGQLINFSRRLYLNNLGTEVRGEDVVESTTKLSFINEFSISDGAKVSRLAYQNGLHIEFMSGKKWILLLSNNIELTTTKITGKIINGVETDVTLIRLEAGKEKDRDCVFKWSLKEM